MDKLDMKTENIVDSNIDFIAKRFPNCITEAKNEKGEIQHFVDFDMLKQELSKEIVEGSDERYSLNWAGKKQAILTANAPINATLRPCKEESVDFDNTKNLYIEGDNLDVLKLLRETYLNKIKMIYIDPPYNTGSDFVYEDDFAVSAVDYLKDSKSYDEQGNKLFQNNDTNGRFHSDWLSMMYSRLKLARDLLTDDGVIFISIGEEEVNNLSKICNDVFGESNRLGLISRVSKTASNKGTFFAPSVDYLLSFAKNSLNVNPFVGEVDESLYKKIEQEGDRKGERYRDDVALYQSALDPLRGCVNQRYYIEAPDGSLLLPPGNIKPLVSRDAEHIPPQTKDDKIWRWTYQTYLKNKHLLVFKETKTSPLIDSNGNQANYNIYVKSYLKDRQEDGTLPRNIWNDFINRKGADLLKKMGIPFDFSKPVELIKYILEISSLKKDEYVLDFFSGSATTAHAVMEYNAENNTDCKFIMVQLPEKCDQKSDAYKENYKTICEIGKERIRRAGKKIKEENTTSNNLDIGFRCLKLDSSCMKDVYYNPANISQDLLANLEDNIKEDRTAEDLLFQVMLDMGVELSSDIKELNIDGKKVFNVNDGNLICCFDKNLNESVVKQIANMHPLYAVFRDSSMASDSVNVNVDQIFETYSPTTTRKVL